MSGGAEFVTDAPDRLDATIGSDGYVREVGRWHLAEAELRVVRWQLRGSARQLVEWARGRDTIKDSETWSVGVVLERRDTPTGKWQTLRRQETDANDLESVAARLRGWEAGLINWGEKLTRRRTG
jgi:hypothetical protein